MNNVVKSIRNDSVVGIVLVSIAVVMPIVIEHYFAKIPFVVNIIFYLIFILGMFFAIKGMTQHWKYFLKKMKE